MGSAGCLQARAYLSLGRLFSKWGLRDLGWVGVAGKVCFIKLSGLEFQEFLEEFLAAVIVFPQATCWMYMSNLV